jgi:NAD-dependent deacetylase
VAQLQKDMDLVLEFYNERRKGLLEAQPNAAHTALARLEEKYDVQVITQNVDDLHERGGSTRVLHLHGELRKVRSTADPSLVYELEGWELKRGDQCERGSQLRPHIVWFGEAVPLMPQAARICEEADLCIIIGTSLQVYPAASLVHHVFQGAPKYYIDPKAVSVPYVHNLEIIQKTAGEGVTELVEKLLGNYEF